MTTRRDLLKGLLAAAFTPALPAEAFESELSELSACIDRFEAAVHAQDWSAVLDILPRRLWQQMAEEMGKSLPELREMMNASMASFSEPPSPELLHFDMGLNSARSGSTEQGRPYALMYSNIEMQFEGDAPFSSQSPIVALKDAGEWSLIRVMNTEYREFVARSFPDTESALAMLDLDKSTFK